MNITTNQVRFKAAQAFIFQENWDMARSVIDDMDLSNEITENDKRRLLEKFPEKQNHYNTSQPKGNMNKLTIEKKKIKLAGLSALPPRQYVFKRLSLEYGTLWSVCGTGSSGKSLFLQYLGACFAAGKLVLGNFPSEKKNLKIFHIDQEQNENMTQRRYERICKGLNINSSELDITRGKLPILLDDPNYTKEQILDFLVSEFSDYDVILIDSLKQINGCDENSSKIAETVNLVRYAAEKSNSLILMIDHMGKSTGDVKQKARGSSGKYDAVDGQMDLTAVKEGDKTIVTVECGKNRDSIYWSGFKFAIEDCGDFSVDQNCSEILAFSLIEKEIKNTSSDKQIKVIQHLKEFPEQNQGQLIKLIGGQRDDSIKLIDNMVQQKILNEREGAKNSRLFSLGENAESFLNYQV